MSDDRHDGEGAGRGAAALLERISRLARQARAAAEGLAARLLEGAAPRPRPARAKAHEVVPAPEATPASGESVAPGPASEGGLAAASGPGPAGGLAAGSAPGPEREDEVAPGGQRASGSGDEAPDGLAADDPRARVVLLPRDPHWLFCYWDLPASPAEGPGDPAGRLALRLHDVTEIDFDGQNSWSQHVYPVTPGARWWHVPIPRPGRHYLAEVGLLAPSGAFAVRGRSAAATAPPAGPSPRVGVEMVTLPLDAPLGLAPLAAASDASRAPDGEAGAGSSEAGAWALFAPSEGPAPSSATPWSVPR